jgi:hypothetical protein
VRAASSALKTGCPFGHAARSLVFVVPKGLEYTNSLMDKVAAKALVELDENGTKPFLEADGLHASAETIREDLSHES